VRAEVHTPKPKQNKDTSWSTLSPDWKFINDKLVKNDRLGESSPKKFMTVCDDIHQRFDNLIGSHHKQSFLGLHLDKDTSPTYDITLEFKPSTVNIHR